MNIAVMTDSNSGITQAQAKDLGVTVIPMPFTINHEAYEEDINLTQDQFYQLIRDENTEILTSQPSRTSGISVSPSIAAFRFSKAAARFFKNASSDACPFG